MESLENLISELENIIDSACETESMGLEEAISKLSNSRDILDEMLSKLEENENEKNIATCRIVSRIHQQYDNVLTMLEEKLEDNQFRQINISE
ncbi:unnamed protein product [Caenorhabditis angaria]|uniref:Uncharacterized protein n=1 Tax=Caenorhabditis angaria TaxID=860376 RepID=A0A9P1I8K7_9PELO|nr:unnamed protein product [Caenorhabditis angaria]